MNKQAIYALFIIGLLAMVGCAKQTNKTTTTNPYVGGTNALVINFIEGSPPTEAYDGGQYPFEVVLSIDNKGEYDVKKEDIKIKLSGFFPADFNNPIIVKNPEEDLSKTYVDSDGNVIPGTITYVTFGGFNYMQKLAANNPFTIRADVCYKYGSTAQTDLCYLEDMNAKDQVCVVTEPKTTFSSSAPVQIENVEESIAGTQKVTFSFDVVQRGAGLVSKLASSCDEDIANKSKVWVGVSTNLTGLSCSGLTDGTATTGYATLYGGKRHVRCTQDIPSANSNFIKKAMINLKYDYKEHQQTEILIKHATG